MATITEPRSNRAMGTFYERQTLKWHQRYEVPCRLTRSSGQLRKIWEDWRSDIEIGRDGARWLWKAEVKSRSYNQRWKRLDEWLGSNDVLVLGTGYVALTEHGYGQVWNGVPSPMAARSEASTKGAQSYLAHADLAILWFGETFTVFTTWETFVEILKGHR